jgi:hypothetical protein
MNEVSESFTTEVYEVDGLGWIRAWKISYEDQMFGQAIGPFKSKAAAVGALSVARQNAVSTAEALRQKVPCLGE